MDNVSEEALALSLTRGNFWQVSKIMVRMYGFEIAGFFDYLVGHHQNIKELIKDEDGYFYIESEKVENAISLYYKQQYNLLKILQDDFGLIDVKIKDNPPKRYIKINYEVYLQILSGEKIVQLYLTKPERERRGLEKVYKVKKLVEE